MKKIINSLVVLLFSQSLIAQVPASTEVLVIGGSTGGTAAAIQSARLGAKTVLIEPTPWLGGMLTAAGVGCTDGNHQLPSGIWNEFREACYKHYGTRNLATGWVSNFNIEPHVGDSIFKAMAAKEKNLTVLFGYHFHAAKIKKGNSGNNRMIDGIVIKDDNNKTYTIKAQVYVDATDLGDVLGATGLPFRKGFEKDSDVGEILGVNENSGIIQDLTYVAILKDFGNGADKTITRPTNYNPMEFDCSNNEYCATTSKLYSNVDAKKMLDYGRLPNKKYMINWPSNGNDFYTDFIEKKASDRLSSIDSAKQKTLRFVYFIQQQLGFKHWGLAEDEFSTADRLAYIPYYREGRRAIGHTLFTIPHMLNPFSDSLKPLYRTGISVGDYPIDHHHREFKGNLPELHFPKVPSYSVPLGSLIPAGIDNFIVCDKSISVSNAANGTTRLQPVILLTGQAAGVLAALSSQNKISPLKVPVRRVQQVLLSYKAMLMPYIDVSPNDSNWQAIQRVGATGIMRGTGKSVGWANQTLFYPDSTITQNELLTGLESFFSIKLARQTSNDLNLSGEMATSLLFEYGTLLEKRYGFKLKPTKHFDGSATKTGSATRKEIARLVDSILMPFSTFGVDMTGLFTGPEVKQNNRPF